LKTEDIKRDICFVVTPIGADESAERRYADGITDGVLKPVLEEFNLVPLVAHRIAKAGSINSQVINNLYTSKLVIANLTGLNPNVMYEVGIRYTMRKPMILICEKGTRLPFDIIEERTIFYANDIAGSEELKDRLRGMLTDFDFDGLQDNPVYRILDFDNAMGKISDESASDALLKQLKDIIQSSKANDQNSRITRTVSIELVDESSKMLTSSETLELSKEILRVSDSLIAPKNLRNTTSHRPILSYSTTFTWEVDHSLISLACRNILGDKFLSIIPVV
jgi:hypothetical protein